MSASGHGTGVVMNEVSLIAACLQFGAGGLVLAAVWLMGRDHKDAMKAQAMISADTIRAQIEDVRMAREMAQASSTASTAALMKIADSLSDVVRESALQRERCGFRECENFHPLQPDPALMRPHGKGV